MFDCLVAHTVGNTLQKLIETLDQCEYAKYAPGAVSADLQTVYSNTVSLVSNIEQHLNKKG